MTVFVYEHLTALAGSGDLESPLPASLLAEGRAMFDAVSADLRAAGVDVVAAATDDEQSFRNAAARADFSLVIAPEFDNLLEDRCRWVEESGGRLLGPSPAAVWLTADKLELFKHFQRHDVPTPALESPGFEDSPRGLGAQYHPKPHGEALRTVGINAHHPSTYPLVLKPRFGAGSQSTFLISDNADRESAREELVRDPIPMIAQEYIPGQPASVSFLIGPRQTIALAPCLQLLSDDGRFHYLGGQTPIEPDLARRAVQLGRRAVDSVSGLFGYVGVDLVLGERDMVIEINPRLTTSYIGLRQLAKFNLAEAMLRVALGESVDRLEWRDDVVKFAPAGVG